MERGLTAIERRSEGDVDANGEPRPKGVYLGQPASASLPKTIQHSSEQPQKLYERLAREGVSHVYIDGGNTIQRFLAAGLVDELRSR